MSAKPAILLAVSTLIAVSAAQAYASSSRLRSPDRTESTTAPQLERLENAAPPANAEGVVVTTNTAETTERIRQADARNRDAILKTVAANLEATEAMLARLRREGLDMKSQGRARFNQAYETVRAREAELRQQLREARRALPDAIRATQAQLARSYEGYAEAVGQIEATVRDAKQSAATE